MTELLLDTHIWLWYLEGSPRLSRRVRTRIDREGNDCRLSPVSIWEFALLVERGRYTIDAPVRAWVDDAHDRYPFRDAPLTREVMRSLLSLDTGIRDPADRFLVATAVAYGATLLTADSHLIDLDWLPTLS